MARQVAVIMGLLVALAVGTVHAAVTSTYTITATATPAKGGTISPAGKQVVNLVKDLPYTFTMMSSAGYYLSNVKVNGTSYGRSQGSSYTFNTLTKNSTIAATFTANPVITVTVGAGGSVSPSVKMPVSYNGSSQTYTFTPNTGYHIDDVKVDGVSNSDAVNNGSYQFTNVTKGRSLKVTFKINTYTITTNPGSGGKITPATPSVNYGKSKQLTITPNNRFQIASVTVDGVAQENLPASGPYTLTIPSVTKDFTIAATFVTAQGLKIGKQVSVVDPHQPDAQQSIAKPLRSLRALSVPDNSDYNTDTTNVYVDEKAGEAFKNVNQILCMINQTMYSDFVNQGFYKAMVNSDVCKGDKVDSSSAAMSGTSATAAPNYDVWTVKSDRASDTSSQFLTAYVHTTDGGGSNNKQPQTIQAKMEITEPATADNPLGIFTINYRGSLDAFPGVTAMKGILKTERDAITGNVVIKFVEQEGPDSAIRHVVKAAYTKGAAATGQGSTHVYENYNSQTTTSDINFAYDDSYFRRVIPSGSDVCLDRKNFETSAWRYGLYDADAGSRADLNGGFSINTMPNGSGYYGYLGYYGFNLNLPPKATAPGNGDTVYKMTWDNNSQTTTPYTLYVRGGKLKKHTQSVLTLDDIKNIPLEGGIPQPGNMTPNNTMYRLTWNGSSLVIIAQAQQNQNGPPNWQDVQPPTVIDSSYPLPSTSLSLYSQSLGGQVNIQLNNCQQVSQIPMMFQGVTCDTPAGDTTVVFYGETTVYPGDDTVPATLACFDNCPKAASSAGMDGTSPQSMTYPMSFGSSGTSSHAYTFDSVNLMLKDGGNNVVLNSTPAGQQWGFNSGALFDPSPANIALLACDWNPDQTCGWKAWSVLDEFYTWETGPNSWNQFTAAKDANGFVKFDAPWQVPFTYPDTSTNGVYPTVTDAKYSGTKFYLQYSGFGDLQGVPGKCVNPDDPSTPVIDCSQGGYIWVPEFTIPAGSRVTVGAKDYLVKPLDEEQRMATADLTNCTNATPPLVPTDMSGSYPSLATDWTNPNLPAEPTIKVPPKVIGGVIQ
jgi:hypothetical protein